MGARRSQAEDLKSGFLGEPRATAAVRQPPGPLKGPPGKLPSRKHCRGLGSSCRKLLGASFPTLVTSVRLRFPHSLEGDHHDGVRGANAPLSWEGRHS